MVTHISWTLFKKSYPDDKLLIIWRLMVDMSLILRSLSLSLCRSVDLCELYAGEVGSHPASHLYCCKSASSHCYHPCWVGCPRPRYFKIPIVKSHQMLSIHFPPLCDLEMHA